VGSFDHERERRRKWAREVLNRLGFRMASDESRFFRPAKLPWSIIRRDASHTGNRASPKMNGILSPILGDILWLSQERRRASRVRHEGVAKPKEV
jgi:hypothetical protein